MITPKMLISNLPYLIFIMFCVLSAAEACIQTDSKKQNILEIAQSTSKEILELRESSVGKEKLVLPLTDPADNDVIISSKYFPVFTLDGEYKIHLTKEGLSDYLLLCLRNGYLPGYSWGILAEIDILTKIFTITTISSREGVGKYIEDAKTSRVHKIGLGGFFLAFRANIQTYGFINDFFCKFHEIQFFKDIQHEKFNKIQTCRVVSLTEERYNFLYLREKECLFIRKIRTWKKKNGCFFAEPYYLFKRKRIKDLKIKTNYFGYSYEEEFREAVDKLVLHCHVIKHGKFPFKFYNILSTNILRQGIDETYMAILRNDIEVLQDSNTKCCCYDITMNPEYPVEARNLYASVVQNPLNPAFFLQNVDNLLTAPPTWYSATLTSPPRSDPPRLVAPIPSVPRQDSAESEQLIPDPLIISDIKPLGNLERPIYDYNGKYVTSIHCPDMSSNPNRYAYMRSIFFEDMFTQLEFQV